MIMKKMKSTIETVHQYLNMLVSCNVCMCM